MTSLIELEKEIRKEARQIIYNKGLGKILERYGDYHLTGSYALSLMAKKDIDITLISSNLDLPNFFQLGAELSTILKSNSMYYRNSIINEIPNRPPNALYWGVFFDQWTLDIWCFKDNSYYLKSDKYIKSIKEKLNDTNREIILNLKHSLLKTGRYGKDFSSKDIYKAVLYHNVTDVEGFDKYFNNY